MLLSVLILSLIPVLAQAREISGDSSVTVSISVMLLARADHRNNIEHCLGETKRRSLDADDRIVCREDGLVLTKDRGTHDLIRVIPI